MLIEVRFARASYATLEDVSMRVRLVNDGAAPARVPDPFHAANWQPWYRVWREGDATARRISHRSARFDDHRAPPEGADPVLVTLEPGGVLEDEVPLRAWAHLDEPGVFHVNAVLEWEEISVTSPEAVFAVHEFQGEVSVGVDVGAASVQYPWLAWLDRDAAGSTMGQSIFHEARPDLGELERVSAEVLHAVRPSVVAVYAPWTTYDRKEELTFWRAWRDGQHLAALEVSLPGPLWFDLGEGGAVVHPVVMSRGGALTACVRTAAGTLVAARFTAQGVAAIAGPRLPGVLCTARVTPDPGDDGASVFVGALCESVDGRACGLVARFDGARGAWDEPVRFDAPGLSPLPRSVAGVTAVAGGARLGFMAQRADGVLVRAEVIADGEVLVREELGAMDDAPFATAVAYGLSPGAAGEAHWAVLLDPARGFSSRGRAPSALPARALMPMELLPITQTVYLALHDPANGVTFHMLR
jgi:hypothetical protein